MIFVLLILSVLISLVQSQCAAPTPYRLAANNTCYAGILYVRFSLPMESAESVLRKPFR